MATQHDKLVYVLSTVRHKRDNVPNATLKKHPPEKKNHLPLLDHLALILVTKATADVAATALVQSPQQIKILYSKNTPCSKEFRDYTSRVLSILARPGDIDGVMLYDLLKEILVTCRERLRKRIQNCEATYASMGSLQFTEEDNSELPNAAKIEPGFAGLNLEEIMTRFFDQLRHFDARPHMMAGNVEASVELVTIAHLVGAEKYLKRYPKLWKRVRKLGAFFAAPRKILWLLTQPAYQKFRGNIELVEIPPPEPQTIQVPKDIVEILNESFKKGEEGGGGGGEEEGSHETITISDLRLLFHDHEFPDDNDNSSTNKDDDEKNTLQQTINTSHHPELTLASYFLSKKEKEEPKTTDPSSPQSIEIGISKGPCWLCQQYIEQLDRLHHLRIVTTQNQGKIYAGWTVPPNTSDALRGAVQDIIQREVVDLREAVLRVGGGRGVEESEDGGVDEPGNGFLWRARKPEVEKEEEEEEEEDLMIMS
jgi:hypothetical protein